MFDLWVTSMSFLNDTFEIIAIFVIIHSWMRWIDLSKYNIMNKDSEPLSDLTLISIILHNKTALLGKTNLLVIIYSRIDVTIIREPLRVSDWRLMPKRFLQLSQTAKAVRIQCHKSFIELGWHIQMRNICLLPSTCSARFMALFRLISMKQAGRRLDISA